MYAVHKNETKKNFMSHSYQFLFGNKSFGAGKQVTPGTHQCPTLCEGKIGSLIVTSNVDTVQWTFFHFSHVLPTIKRI